MATFESTIDLLNSSIFIGYDQARAQYEKSLTEVQEMEASSSRSKKNMHQSLQPFLDSLSEVDHLAHESDDAFARTLNDLKFDLGMAASKDKRGLEVMEILMQEVVNINSESEEFKLSVGLVLAFGMIAGIMFAGTHGVTIPTEVANG